MVQTKPVRISEVAFHNIRGFDSYNMLIACCDMRSLYGTWLLASHTKKVLIEVFIHVSHNELP